MESTVADAEKKAPRPANRRTNRLIHETSPYLLQHAHNPVDWHPWGPEAFERARREQKPIFLSIGYSSCHWCHVMERETFEDEKVAAFLNDHFVSIKVDREERPDVDEIYMHAVQMLTGRGGWPLTVFLTPDLKPFYGGTYFPPEPSRGMPSFTMLIEQIADAWGKNRSELLRNSQAIANAVREQLAKRASASETDLDLDRELITRACLRLDSEFDPEWGGFGTAPKFPPAGAVSLLLRQHARTGDAKTLDMATITLDRMAYGGMYDQVGGGFARYSTDRRWLVPHFEKMLYDNALLAQVYIDAWQLTRKPLYRRIATETLDYVLREMTDEAGGFHSAEDADSEGVEGKYYVWSREEILEALGEEDAAVFNPFYGVTKAGNFEGRNILHVAVDPAEFAKSKGWSEDELWERLRLLRLRLRVVRDARVHPGRDDKVLAAWNGMMLSAMARAAQAFDEPRYLAAARRAADFLLADMVQGDVLLRTYRKGRAKLPGYLDDYAMVANGLIDVYQASFHAPYARAAQRLAAKMLADFHDARSGLFFFTSHEHKNLLARTTPTYDGATPSGNASAALAFLRLGALFYNQEYIQTAQGVLRAAAEDARRAPRAFLDTLCALDLFLDPPREFAVVGSPEDSEVLAFLAVIHDRYLPNKIIALGPGAEPDPLPILKDKPLINGRPAVYVCRNFVCLAPVTTTAELRKMIERGP